MGALYAVIEEPSLKQDFLGLERLDEYLKEEKLQASLEPLAISEKNLHVPII